ncbi:MAG: winged helix-turn-helix domain-containing protein [Paludibacteraceae bacterium]
MYTEKIGTNAGLVWAALENGELEVKAIKKATKLTEKDLNLALGWLAREGKVSFREVEKDLYVALA